MSVFEIVMCMFAWWFLRKIGEGVAKLRQIVAQLEQIAAATRDTHALLVVNSTKQVPVPDENLSPNELCRRFRIKLEEAQQRKRRR